MLRVGSFFVFMFSVLIAGAQSINLGDSIKLASKLRHAGDSLKIVTWADTLRVRTSLRFQADSARAMADGVNDRSRETLDSLRTRRDKLNTEITSKQKEIQKNVTLNYKKWQEKLDSKLAGLPKPNTPGVPNMPHAQLPGADIKLPDKQILEQLPTMPGLRTADFSSVSLSPDLGKLAGSQAIPSDLQLNQWEQVVTPQSLAAMQQQAKATLADSDKILEKAAMNLDATKDVSQELGQANAIRQNEATQAADAMKNPEVAYNKAVNHFAGKEEVLQAAMDKMDKFKKQYYSLPDINSVKRVWWKPHNGLKGIPFRERFRYGLHLAYRPARDTIILDFFPNVSYRISGRIEAGLGVIYQTRITTRVVGLDTSHPAWGTSMFTIVKTFKNTYIRFEVDGRGYERQRPSDPVKYVDWRWSALSGVQTNFTISSNCTGNVQMLYSFDKNIKDAFPERLVMRIGVQWKLGYHSR